MTIRCLFGHDGTGGVSNAGLIFTRCGRCGRDLFRVRGGRWYEPPRGFAVRWRATGAHAAPPADLLHRAHCQTPLLHRLRRQRRLWQHFHD